MLTSSCSRSRTLRDYSPISTSGRRVRKQVMGHSRNEVADKLAALMRAHEEKRPIPSQREKVGPFLRPWLDEVAKPTLRAST